MDMEDSTGSTRKYTITDVAVGTNVQVQVRPVATGVPGLDPTVGTNSTADVTVALLASMTPDSYKPGSNTRYTLKFTPDKTITTGTEDVTIELEDFTFSKSTISTSDVAVSVRGPYEANGTLSSDPDNVSDDAKRTFTNTPQEVVVDAPKLTVSFRVLADDFVAEIDKNTEVTIVIRQAAGVKNPSEGGAYGGKGGDLKVAIDGEASDQEINEITVLRTISLDPEDGSRGDTVTLTGKGFKDKTTLIFIRLDQANPADTSKAQSLCAAQVGGDDIGSCEVAVTSPLFLSRREHDSSRRWPRQ